MLMESIRQNQAKATLTVEWLPNATMYQKQDEIICAVFTPFTSYMFLYHNVRIYNISLLVLIIDVKQKKTK